MISVRINFILSEVFFILCRPYGMLRHSMSQGEDLHLDCLEWMYLPSGQRLGVVYDVVIDTNGIKCTHLFVRQTDHELVEGGINVAVPWRWARVYTILSY